MGTCHNTKLKVLISADSIDKPPIARHAHENFDSSSANEKNLMKN